MVEEGRDKVGYSKSVEKFGDVQNTKSIFMTLFDNVIFVCLLGESFRSTRVFSLGGWANG